MTPDPLILAAIRVVARSGDPDATVDELLEIGMRAAGADRAAAFLWDSELDGLALAAARGYPPDDLIAIEAAVGRTGHPVQLAAQERIQTTGEPSAADGSRILSSWPVVVGRDGIEEPIGALAFEAPVAATAEVSERVAALADLVAVVVDRARLASHAAERIDWAERVANSDLLTGLASARTAARVMELEIARAARQGSELTVALFDIDDLTGINDRLGRSAGDEILRTVAAAISGAVRFVDTVARWGGDEFLLVAPGAKGTTVARRIVEAVAAAIDTADRRCTVSAGLARFPADGTASDDLVRAAEGALAAARSVGPGTFAEATHDASNGAGSSVGSGANGS